MIFVKVQYYIQI